MSGKWERLWDFVRPDMAYVYVALTFFGQALLGTIFNFYYMKVFLEEYSLSTSWLNISQILFMIWNALNDPLFGYLQDIQGRSRSTGRFGWLKSRKKVILYMGPFYAASFMVPWFGPWDFGSGTSGAAVGLHLIVSLFLWDTFVTFVGSAHCGLFTEMTTTHTNRVRIVRYMQFAGLCSSFIIFPTNAISGSLADLGAFRGVAGVVAVVSAACFIVTGLKAPEPHLDYQPGEEPIDESPKKSGSFLRRLLDHLRPICQIVCNRDFLSVALTEFAHIVRVTQNQNFLAIFTEALVPADILPLQSVRISVFYTVCGSLPMVLILIGSPLLVRFGPWLLLMGSVVGTCVNCLVFFCIGRTNPYAVMAFFLIDRLLSHSLWPALYHIFLPNVIDNDFRRNKRRTPLSTMAFTMSALITKPAFSLAPVLVVNVLNQNGLFDLWKNADTRHGMAVEDVTILLDSMFYVACFTPVIIGLVQAILMIPYRLKFSHQMSLDKPEHTKTSDEETTLGNNEE